ncbi:legume lectins beta domain protein [Enterococcus faecalis 13-SD-W-01]|nr:legume lectins beta domain protein [Enterococcus faecalis 13-SD-W-01]
MKKLLWLVFGLLSFLSFLPEDKVYAEVLPPNFSTIDLTGNVTFAGTAPGTIRGNSPRQYVDVVGRGLLDGNKPGGVWFNEPLDLSEDFYLEMYFAAEMPSSLLIPSEGFAFVLQSQGLDAIAQEGGQSLGVWANQSIQSPPVNLANGAIQDGVAVEFDMFKNNLIPNYFDRGIPSIIEGGSHIAWNYPGRHSTYTSEFILEGLGYYKTMKHRDLKTYTDLDALYSFWNQFTVKYEAATGLLTYYAQRWMNAPVTLNLMNPEDGSSAPVFDNPEEVYFGFTGANSLILQQRAVAFRKIENGNTIITPDDYDTDSRVTLEGSMKVDEDLIVPDVNTGSTPNLPVTELSFDDFTTENNTNKKTFTYNIDAKYENDGLESLPEGAKLAIRVPDILEIKRESTDLTDSITVYINGVQKEFVLVSDADFSGEGGEYKRIDGQYIFSLPELTSGDIVSISLQTVVKSDLSLITNQKIDSKEVFAATFAKDDIYVETGERDTDGQLIDRPRYILKAIFGPTLTGDVYDSSGDAIVLRTRIFQEQGFSIDLGADDLNSTNVTVYASEWLREEDNPPVFDSDDPSNHEDLGTFKRISLTDDFTDKGIDFSGMELPGFGIFYKVFYLLDVEGNVSSPQYLAVEILERGEVELSGIPNFLFESINLLTISSEIGLNDFVDVNLKEGEVTPDPSLGITEGNNARHLVIYNRNSKPANWRLNAFLDNFNIVRYQNTGTILATDIELHLTVDGKTRIISASTNVIHEEKDDINGFYQTIDQAKLRIRRSALHTPGVYQGAITWELVDSVQ